MDRALEATLTDMVLQHGVRLTEVGQYYDFINESVTARDQYVAIARARSELCQAPLPPRPSGAIIGRHRSVTNREAPMSFGPGEIEPSQSHGGDAVVSFAPTSRVTFNRRELDRLLGLYGRKVAAGEWRDYAIDFLKDRAVFSVFRRACEGPIYRIEKRARQQRRPGAYSVISATGLILRRGHELDPVLRAIDRSLSVVAG